MEDRFENTSGHSLQLTFPLPKAPQTQIHTHLTINSTSILLFLTTIEEENTAGIPALGSFVYALPDRLNPGRALSTPLYTHESSLEFTNRMAQSLVRKLSIPVYVGNSMSFASTGLGGTVEEEIEGFKTVVDVVMTEINKLRNSTAQTNGILDH